MPVLTFRITADPAPASKKEFLDSCAGEPLCCGAILVRKDAIHLGFLREPTRSDQSAVGRGKSVHPCVCRR